MHSLPVFLRLEGRAVILIGEGAAADAKRRLLERAGAVIVGEDSEAQLALVATSDPDAIAGRLKARGILVNVADRPDLCDFTLPAIVDRDPVLVAIGTGGASAGLAKALRQWIEALLPASLGALATGLGDARARMRARWPDARDRRRAIDAALEGLLDPLSGRVDVETWLAAPDRDSPPALVAIRLASPDPDDLTLRQARWLGQADRLYHRVDVPAAILDRARADAVRTLCNAPPADPGPGLSLDLSMERP
ncbi:MAG: bifunctional precorrin-2 dehydrogenase/sirohydrochlorin ferrochelatase [Proteobacteria bacterium]|nr:bifunctional precorrin-2 dehydrogenase/sirohydrochlorin ferrochelatase [Pseudomonadota bacterium]